ncbi:hypothetical protein [Flectobacillus roseus]|uniref:hypothetical protein n=1 Tax=Flectobacillus roseus TaxID=502259 RepID=UPI0024B7E697|nr:hypothetical protein [Flectobacillus roseus]MDI9868964.1 hypothetical protein [Flectobacillus roseus]
MLGSPPVAKPYPLAAILPDNDKNEIYNKMRILLSILLLTLSMTNLLGQSNSTTTKPTDKSFPTNIQEGSEKELDKFDGKIVAFDGTIEKIEKSRNNTPFYKLKIADDNYLWTVLMFKNKSNKIGDKVRVVGYLRPNEPNKDEKKYLDGKYMVIAFGLIDFNKSNFLFLGGARQQKQEWIDGKIPSGE